MRACELTVCEVGHTVRARDLHLGTNKDKLMIVLYSSKTHNKESRLQKIKIVANKIEKSGHYLKRHFCPFKLVNRFINNRQRIAQENEPIFIFRDGMPVTDKHAREVLKDIITKLGLEAHLYGLHSFRIGRMSDLAKYGYSIEEIRRMGRWQSNTVYKYIRD